MTDCPAVRKLVGDLVGFDGRNYPRRHLSRIKDIDQGQTIHHRRQHTDVVGRHPLDTVAGQLGAPGVITAADHNHDLDTTGNDFFDFTGQPGTKFDIDTTIEFTG